MKCGKCNRELKPGDEATVHEYREIKTVGTKVTFRDVPVYYHYPRCPK